MIFDMVFDSQFGPFELEVYQLDDGSVGLWFPRLSDPIIIKNDRVRIAVQVPGPPVPVSIKAWRPQVY